MLKKLSKCLKTLIGSMCVRVEQPILNFFTHACTHVYLHIFTHILTYIYTNLHLYLYTQSAFWVQKYKGIILDLFYEENIRPINMS